MQESEKVEAKCDEAPVKWVAKECRVRRSRAALV